MGKSIEKDGFKVDVLPGSLKVGTLSFSPAEAAKMTSLLSWAGNMASMEVLPPTIGHAPFEVIFVDDGTHALCRTDAKGLVKFRFEQIDALVSIINNGIETHKNNLDVQSDSRLRNRGRMATVGANAPDIIDGRG